MAIVQIGQTQHDVGDSVFFDANFLISSAASSETDHQVAALLMLQFMPLRKHRSVELYVSPMVLSETWWNLCKVEYEAAAGRRSWVHLAKQAKVREFAQRWNRIRERTRFWLESVSMQVIDVSEPDVHTAAQALSHYQLAPADAFHVAVMQRHGIPTIVTNDSDFSVVSGLKQLPFQV